MNDLLLRAFVKKIKSENMNNTNTFTDGKYEYTIDPFNENSIINHYFDMIEKHDYSYQYSDDHRYWMAGHNSEKEIEKLIDIIVNQIGYEAEQLHLESLENVKEGFVDGLTHRTINNWFSKFNKQ